jgi:hypothetical protein
MTRASVAALVVSALFFAVACRTSDPKTEPNTPIPKIEKQEEPKPGPSLGTNDAG